jgi:hypothetical protein
MINADLSDFFSYFLLLLRLVFVLFNRGLVIITKNGGEQSTEPSHGELVHRVQQSQTLHNKVELCSLSSQWSQNLAIGLYSLFDMLRNRKFISDVICDLARLFHRVNEVV